MPTLPELHMFSSPCSLRLAISARYSLPGNEPVCVHNAHRQLCTEGRLKFILKRTPSKAFMLIFRLIATALVFVGALLSAGIVWDTADMLQAFMVIINVPVIIIIAKPALAGQPKDYMSQRKEGRIPCLNSSIGLEGKTEYKIDRQQKTGLCHSYFCLEVLYNRSKGAETMDDFERAWRRQLAAEKNISTSARSAATAA